MVQAPYPYLDLTVLPELRPHLIAPYAAVVFSPSLDQVVWANGEGARLIGSQTIRQVLESEFQPIPGTMRQIAMAVEKLGGGETASATMRLRSGFKSRLLGFSVSNIKLPRGEAAILLVTDPLHGRAYSQDDMVSTLVGSLDGFSHASAVVDQKGATIAASEHFPALAVTDSEAAQLAAEALDEADGLVKRPIATQNGLLPAGLAKLDADGNHNLLIIADADEETEGMTPIDASSASEAVVDIEPEAPQAPEAPVAEEEEVQPTVGAFSNRRSGGQSALGRWYYKPKQQAASDGDKEAADDPADGTSSPTSEEEPTSSSVAKDDDQQNQVSETVSDANENSGDDAPVLEREEPTPQHEAAEPGKQDREPDPTALAAAGFIQEVSHTGVSASDDGAVEDHENQPAPGETDEGGESVPAGDGESDALKSEADGFRFTAGSKPVRFVWELDDQQIFRSVSAELSETVGPAVSNITGLSWSEVSAKFNLENGDEIAELLSKGDTWFGKTVLWPVEATDLRVPIDFAGLPSYGRNRNFEGFNGFGIVRTADAMVDPEAFGLAFAGKREAQPKKQSESQKPSRQNGKGSAHGKSLSSDEQETFQEIADKLTDEPKAEKPAKQTDRQSGESSANPVGFIPSAFAKKPNGSVKSKDQTKEAPADEKKTAKPVRVIRTRPAAKISSKSAKAKARAISSQSDNAADQAANDTRAEKSETPKTVQINRTSAQGNGADNTSDAKPKIRTPDHNVDTSILARLPIPVLVYRDNDLLFGNSEFFQLTGYDDLQALAGAGGVDALFGATKLDIENAQASIFHRSGDILDVHAHLQRVPWDDHKAMLLTLRKDNDGDDGDDGKGNGEPGSDGTDGRRSSSRIDGAGNGNAPLSSGRPDSPKMDSGSLSKSEAGSRGSAGTGGAQVTPLRAIDGGQSAANAAARASKGPFGGLGHEDLRNIIDTATDGVVILSEDGIVRAMNRSAEALLDVESDRVIDQSFTKLLAPESHRAAMDYVNGMAGTGVASLMNDGREVIGKTGNGGLVPLFMTIGKLQKNNACCVVMRDITQWKKAEEELVTAKSQAESASEQKTEFLAKVSHEIRTPLNAIIGFSDIMIEERFGKIDNDRYRGYLRDIHRSGNHVLELINDLLDISKIESGKMELEFDACDLNTIVSETVALTQPDANKERVIIRTSLSAMVPKVVADSRSLRQIILNLVSNSIKYTKSGGQVIVSTVYEESGEVVLRVRDTGVGMSQIELARALKPFQQVGSAPDTDQQGTGLGLPLTKAMVEANRAEFHIESQPEEGTLVEVHFPNQRVLADR